MIGDIIMEITHDEMKAAIQFYLNRDVFDASDGGHRQRHVAYVDDVHQRTNGNFIVEFHGWYLPKESDGDNQ